MADGEDQVDESNVDGEDEDGEATTGGKKKLVIIVVAILLLGGIGAGLFFSGIIGGGADTEESSGDQGDDDHADDGHGAVDEHGNPSVEGPVFHELPEFLVNLSTTGKKVSFLKMKVILEFESEAVKAQAMLKEPRILDSVNTYLRELRASDLQGSAGLYRLREEMLMRVNKVIEPDAVKDILFREFLTQ